MNGAGASRDVSEWNSVSNWIDFASGGRHGGVGTPGAARILEGPES